MARARIVRSSPDRLARSWWARGRSIQDHDTNGRLRVVDRARGPRARGDRASALRADWRGSAVPGRRFAVEDRTLHTATSYIPLDVVAAAPAVADTGPGPGGMYARMAEAGLGPETFRETLVCRMPTLTETAELTLPKGTPVIAITRYAYTSTRRCVEVNQMVLDSSAYTLEYLLNA